MILYIERETIVKFSIKSITNDFQILKSVELHFD